MDLARRIYSRDLKIAAIREIDGGRRIGELARRVAGADRTATNRRAGAENRPAHDGERFSKKSVGAFQGSSPASRRQWRGCLFEGIRRAGYYRWRVPPQSFPVEMELRDAMQQIALEFPAYAAASRGNSAGAAWRRITSAFCG